MLRSALALSALLAFMLLAAPVQAQVAQAQRLLNALGLEAGPADGAAGEKTMRPWREFLAHRGLPPETPLDAAGLAELKGQQDVRFPQAKGLTFHVNAGRFPSKDTYRLDENDPTAFSVTLRPGDHDPVNYTGSGSSQERQHGWSLFKQRAEIDSQELRAGRTYTVDFEVKIENVGAGTFFQVHRGDSGGAMMFEAFPNAIRINASEAIQNMAVYQGDWFDKWLRIRLVFHPSPSGDSWFRTYVNGEMTLDTSKLDARYPMHEATLHFGLYRGASRGQATTASFRGIALSQGDLGPPGAAD
jgi:peptidoglycan hydrolase-like protein with peptidoglycan-binding domain